MLTARYMPSTKNINDIFDKIVGGVAPEKFTVEHLRGLGFTSSNDRAIIPLLKDLGFLTPDGAPTPRYNAYRDRSQSRAVMADAIRDAYSDVFHINEKPTATDRPAVEGLFKSRLNSSDRVAQVQAMTFYALLARADLNAKTPRTATLIPEALREEKLEEGASDSASQFENAGAERGGISTQLHYTIQIHLPATKELEVYNAIFRSLRENLLA